MTTLTANYSDKTSSTAAGKIRTALRNILVRFVQVHESQAAMMSADYSSKLEGAAELKRMAKRFEVSQPNLAAELRYIASRG